MEEAEADALAYLDFPEAHRRRMRTNNVTDNSNLPGVTRLSFRT